jgi:hypothetical protein
MCFRFIHFILISTIGIKLHNLQYDEGGNHMAETETETSIFLLYDRNNFFELL